MSIQYCFVPSNPDVSGIGVRWSIYILACITVIHGFICRFKNGKLSPLLKNTIVTQIVLLATFVVYMAIQPTPISEFHKLVATNLVWIGYSSCCIAWLATHRLILRMHEMSWEAVAYMFWWGFTKMPIFWTLPVWILVILALNWLKSLQQGCIPHPDSPGGHDDVAFWWVQLAGGTYVSSNLDSSIWIVISIAIHWVSVPCSATVVLHCIRNIVPRSWRVRLSGTGTPLALLTVVQALIMVSSICTVEIALYKSPVDMSQENTWGYGQAFPIALLFTPAWSLAQEIMAMFQTQPHPSQRSLPESNVDVEMVSRLDGSTL